MFNGEIIFLKKDTEKVVLLHYKWKIQGLKKLYVQSLSCTKFPFLGHKNIVQENYFEVIL